MQGKNQIIQYSNTSESLAPNGIKVTLHGRDLWSKFHKSTTEMIITKAGRLATRMQHVLYIIIWFWSGCVVLI